MEEEVTLEFLLDEKNDFQLMRLIPASFGKDVKGIVTIYSLNRDTDRFERVYHGKREYVERFFSKQE